MTSHYYYKENEGKAVTTSNKNFTLHRDNGPAIINFMHDDFLAPKSLFWYLDGKPGRVDKGPTEIHYHLLLKSFRTHFPFIASFFKQPTLQIDLVMWRNEQFKIHRSEGPAILRYSQNGKLIVSKWMKDGKEVSDASFATTEMVEG